MSPRRQDGEVAGMARIHALMRLCAAREQETAALRREWKEADREMRRWRAFSLLMLLVAFVALALLVWVSR